MSHSRGRVLNEGTCQGRTLTRGGRDAEGETNIQKEMCRRRGKEKMCEDTDQDNGRSESRMQHDMHGRDASGGRHT